MGSENSSIDDSIVNDDTSVVSIWRAVSVGSGGSRSCLPCAILLLGDDIATGANRALSRGCADSSHLLIFRTGCWSRKEVGRSLIIPVEVEPSRPDDCLCGAISTGRLPSGIGVRAGAMS